MSKAIARRPAARPLGWWDRFLLGVAPDFAMRRLRARASAELLARHYDATGGGRRTSGWHRRATDANAAAQSSLASLRELSRDLRRNNGWARRAIQVIGANTVGWGIGAKADIQDPAIKARAEDIWRRWSESVACDYDGRLTFSGLQRLLMETVAESGEALIVREAGGAGDGLPVPLRVRVLEPDYLDLTTQAVTLESGERREVVQGIELDERGRRAAYWLYDRHPGAAGVGVGELAGSYTARRVPAARVLHVYRSERPGQMRGVPWLAAAIAKLQDFDEYDDARLMQAKIAACFAAFVEDVEGEGNPLGEPDASDDELETLEPGHISYLSPGQRVSFATPPATSDHGAFSEVALRRIAATIGVTYEELTGDYSRVNFSSARMARLAHWANVYDWRWNMLIPQACDGVWRWVMELAAELEGWTAVPAAGWAPPPMPMLEPEKEGLAYQRLVRSGAMTMLQMIRERGEDPDAHLAEIAEGNARLDALGIVLDSDPRRVTVSGQVQAGDSAGELNDGGGA